MSNDLENIKKDENKNDIQTTENITQSNSKYSFNKFSIISSIFSTSCNLPIVTKSIDSFLGVVSVGEVIFGIAAWFTMDKITSIGYISGGIFAGLTLILLRKNRLQASMQQSVNVLQEENEELKESNDELKENIDDLETVSNKLNEDLKMLRESIGLFGINSEEVLDKFREIYQGLKKENEIHSKLNKNMIFLNIVQIIKMYEKHNNNVQTYTLKIDDLIRAKKPILNIFPNLNFNELLLKIKKYEKINAKNIYECVKNIK